MTREWRSFGIALQDSVLYRYIALSTPCWMLHYPMLRFSANVSLMYPDLPLLERFAAAHADGFRGVEMQFPYEIPSGRIAAHLNKLGLTQVLINAPPGNLGGGDFGLAAVPGRQEDFADTVELAIDYARALGCSRIHVMAGLVSATADLQEMRAVYVDNLKKACARFAAHELLVLIEPINTHDVPGYFLHRLHDAFEVLREVGAPNLRMLMDFYHLQMMEGGLTRAFETYREYVGHVQIAGVPGRHEPDVGEINYRFVFDALQRLEYPGWVGCEYRPAHSGSGGTSSGLGWMASYREMSEPQ
jgi:hydroxypyruvate isomerase